MYRPHHELVAKRSQLANAGYGRLDLLPSQLGTLDYVWHGAGSCTSPVTIETATRHADRGGLDREQPIWLEQHFRCRKCDACMAARRWHWRHRAGIEATRSIMNGQRVWFVTLTCSPATRAHAVEETRSLAFGPLVYWMSKEVSLYLKKLRRAPVYRWRQRRKVLGERWKRENPGKTGVRAYLQEACGPQPADASFRYLAVAEAHKDGFPHYHLLVYEQAGEQLRERDFRALWGLGFAEAQLARGPGASLYVCKYITKETRGRLRSSIGFGKTVSDPSNSKNKLRDNSLPLPNKDETVSRVLDALDKAFNHHSVEQTLEYYSNGTIPLLVDCSTDESKDVPDSLQESAGSSWDKRAKWLSKLPDDSPAREYFDSKCPDWSRSSDWLRGRKRKPN